MGQLEELFFCHHIIGEFVGIIGRNGKMPGKQDPYSLDSLRKGITGTTFFNSSGNLIRKPIQGFLIHLLVNAFIRKNPDFPFEEGEKEEDPCILLCLIKPFLKEGPFSPQSDRFLFSSDSNKEFFQCLHSLKEQPAGKKNKKLKGT